MTATRRPARRVTFVASAVAALLVLAAAGGLWWWSSANADPAPAAMPELSSPSADPLPAGDAAARLPAATEMGVVELKVANIANVLSFYRDAVGMQVFEEGEGTALLGLDIPVIRLVATDDPLDAVSDAGLYHSAVLFADAPSLARALVRIGQAAPYSYQGASDHAVSQAFYFADPEGNGLELYIDRPRDQWVWENGRVTMGSAPLDVDAFVAEHLPQEASEQAKMGHVHLRVGDLDEARAFYEGVLGFDVTAEVDGALFYSAGGYHHHLATNTWLSAGAGARSATAGLGSFTMTMPELTDVAAVAARLDAAGAVYQRIDGGIAVDDPWGNTVRAVVASPS